MWPLNLMCLNKTPREKDPVAISLDCRAKSWRGRSVFFFFTDTGITDEEGLELADEQKDG